MRKVIFLSGLSIALFTAGLIFFANSGARNAAATETGKNSVNGNKATTCQCASGTSCGCGAENGSCSCGKNTSGTCPNAGTKTSCGCNKNSTATK